MADICLHHCTDSMYLLQQRLRSLDHCKRWWQSTKILAFSISLGCLSKPSRPAEFAKFHNTCEPNFPWDVCTCASRPGSRYLSRYSNGSHHNNISHSFTTSSTFDSKPSWKYYKNSFVRTVFELLCHRNWDQMGTVWGVNNEENKPTCFRSPWHIWSEFGLCLRESFISLPHSFLLLLPF